VRHHDRQRETAVEDFGREDGPASGTLYTQRVPRRRTGDEQRFWRAQIEPVREHTARRAAINFGAASRPIDAPRPITISETIDVKKLRAAKARLTVPDGVVDVDFSCLR